MFSQQLFKDQRKPYYLVKFFISRKPTLRSSMNGCEKSISSVFKDSKRKRTNNSNNKKSAIFFPCGDCLSFFSSHVETESDQKNGCSQKWNKPNPFELELLIATPDEPELFKKCYQASSQPSSNLFFQVFGVQPFIELEKKLVELCHFKLIQYETRIQARVLGPEPRLVPALYAFILL